MLRIRLQYPLICAILLWIGCSSGTPAVRFQETEYDFGPIKPPVSLTHVFSFKNTGTGTLTIKQVKPG